jgi:hypothetical protein
MHFPDPESPTKKEAVWRKRSELLMVVISLLLLFLRPLNLVISHLSLPCERWGDYSFLAIDILLAAGGELFSGPYSRFHFRHPLPTASYLHALGGFFFGYSYRVYDLVQIVLNFLSLGVGCYGIWRFLGGVRLQLLYLGFIALLLPASRVEVLADMWGPSAILCPLLGFFPCVYLLITGRNVFLLPSVLTALLAASNHLSGAIMVVPFLAWGLFSVAYKRRIWIRSERLCGYTSLFCLVASFTLPLYELYTYGRKSNLWSLFTFLFVRPSRHPNTIQEIFDGLSDSFEPFFPSIPFIVGIIGISVLLIVANSRSVFGRYGLFIVGAWLFLALVSFQIEGPLRPYLFWNHIVLLVHLLVAASGIVISWINFQSRRVLDALFQITLLGLVVFRSNALDVRHCSSIAGEAEHAFRAMVPESEKLIGFGFPHPKSGGRLGPIILEAMERNVPFCTIQDKRYLLGHSAQCKEPHSVEVRIEGVPKGKTDRLCPGTRYELSFGTFAVCEGY